MKVLKAILKTTGEIISVYDSEYSGKGKLLQDQSRQNLLLCYECEKPVEVILYHNYVIPFIFVCHSELDHLDYLDPDSPIHEEFAQKEEEYYDPDLFDDKDK